MPFNICCRQIYWKKNQTYWKLCKIEIYRISPLSKRPIQAPCCDIFTCSKLCQLIERIRHLDHIQGSTHAAWDCIIRQWCCCWIRCIFESFHKCLLRRTQCRLQSILSVQRSCLESCMFVLNSCTCKYERNSDSYIMQIPDEISEKVSRANCWIKIQYTCRNELYNDMTIILETINILWCNRNDLLTSPLLSYNFPLEVLSLV